MSNLEEENAPAKPCGPTAAATCVLGATEEAEKKLQLPKSEPGELPKRTPSREMGNKIYSRVIMVILILT